METFKRLTKGISYPYGIISDVHCNNWSAYGAYDSEGINTRLKIILDSIEQASNKILELGGKDLIITGDLFHTRGTLKPSVLNPTMALFHRLTSKGIVVHAFDGNHDMEGKVVNELNSSLYPLTFISGFNVYYYPTIVDDKFLFIPWEDKPTEVLDLVTKGSKLFSNLTAFCHVGMSGVLPGNLGDTLHPADFDKLDIKYVFSGHFHNHVSFNSRIYSVGALTHQTWGDVGSKAGFVIVHDEKVEHFETKAPKFMDLFDGNPEDHAGNYVRVQGEYSDKQLADIRVFLADNNSLAVQDQSTKPTIKNKDASKEIKVDLGINTALETYCKHVYGAKWKEVYDACLKLKS